MKNNAEIAEAERKSGIRTILRVVPYLWPKDRFDFRVRVISALALLVLAKLVINFAPFLYREAVNALTETGNSPFLLGAVGMTVAYGSARILSRGFEQLRDVVFAAVAQRAFRNLALETFQHIHKLSLRYHISRKTGALSRVIERGVKGLEFLLRFLLFSIGPLVLELLIIAGIMLFWFDYLYLSVIVVMIAAYIWFTFKVTEWRVKIRKFMNDQDTDANQKAIDSLLNYETVKYFSAEEREAKRYGGAIKLYEKAALTTAYSLAFLNFGQSLIITAGLIIVMVMAALGVQSGNLTVGDFVMVNAYMIQITMPLNFLGTVYREIRQGLVDMGEMFDLLEQPTEIIDSKKASELKVISGHISLENITFGYDKLRPIIKNVSFEIHPRETIAIVGPSGSGKSTIGRLLFRFYDAQKGSIKIDGQDIRDITQKSLHSSIGVVPQDTVLFNDTIYYNIAYGLDNASQADVEKAAKDAQIHDFILSLPEGYETTVGERGLKLSGGEKQRVGIARTLLKNPPILLLDEATSALDTETEQEIRDALTNASEGRSVLTIAHRLSTIADADKIIVLENGVIAEMGTHEELLNKKGRYYSLWTKQLSEEKPAA
ncbi:MAG: ABC transporter ATP-binding protein/permease [Rhodobacteraceae bacterium]|nr:ABC transporter ATP-binding protein/permease [Paracoccaceae bacterium]